jgi:hypothetical protein
MRTSLCFLALAGCWLAPLPSASADEVVWQKSYRQAQEHGQKAGKPLAVFVGVGQTSPEQTVQEGSFSNEITKILADHYVCVYLDADRPENRSLVEQFGITARKGLVLSDRTGELQAFHNDGPLKAAELAKQLRHFSGPNVVVQTTVSNAAQGRVSFYPPQAPAAAPAPLASYSQPVVPGFQPGYSPSFQPSFGASLMGGGRGGC